MAITASDLHAEDVVVRLVPNTQAQVSSVVKADTLVHVAFEDGSGMTYRGDETLHVLRTR